MKAMKKVMALGLALAMVVTAVPATPVEAASTAKLSTKKVTVAVGTEKAQTKNIKVTTPSTWKSVKVTASSSKKSVAKVKVSGKTVKVTAVKKGSATVTVKVTGKKSGKKVSKTLKATAKVVGAGARFTSENPVTVLVGKTAEPTLKVCPTAAKATYTSSDEKIATVDANGVITGVAAGEATITAVTDYGKKAELKVVVKTEVAELASVTQTAANAFTATFTDDASKTITKDDFAVKADNGTQVLNVKTIDMAADGKSATVTLYGVFADKTAYTVTCKDKTASLVASVGDVTKVDIKTASAAKDVETPIEFALYDANGIDVTSAVNVDTTCMVDATGTYTSLKNTKASKASITMGKVGDKATVTVKYNKNDGVFTDVVATKEITCENPSAVTAPMVYAATNVVNAESECAKFYQNGVASDKPVAVEKGKKVENLYFCAKNGDDVVSYDEYTAEVSDDTKATVAVTKNSGKYAEFTVVGTAVGSAQINITATKNGVSTNYYIPITVTEPIVATDMKVTVTRPVMSDVKDSYYYGEIKPQMYDKDGNKVAGHFKYEVLTTVSGTPLKVSDAGKVTAMGAVAKTYTIQVTGSQDDNESVTIKRNVTVQVKHLPTEKAIALTYAIELDRNVADQNPEKKDDDAIKAKLYATYNGLFAGYVQDSTTGRVADAGSGVQPTTPTAIADVKVGAKFGTLAFTTTDGFVTAAATTGASIGNPGTWDTFKAVDDSKDGVNGTTTYDVATKSSKDLAKTGQYTIVYYYEQDGKNLQKSVSVTVKNTVQIPTITTTTKVVDTFSNDDIKKALKTNVDMNNNNSLYESILDFTDADFVTLPSTVTDRKVLKQATVKDNYDYYTNGVKTSTQIWNFVIPVNATFKME